MRQVGREKDLEKINRIALQVAREVAQEKNLLFAGGVSNTNIFRKGENEDQIRAMFDEQVRWSKEEGVDYIIAETFSVFEEAKIALDVIKSHNLPAVVTFSARKNVEDGSVRTFDGVLISKACRELLENGAALVGVNCTRGPETMLEVVEEIVKVCPPERVCALPVAFRTTKEAPVFFSFTDSACPANNPVYPRGMQPFSASPVEIQQFTKRCMELGLKYLGICCGNSGELTRTMAEAMGKKPPASRYFDPSNFGTVPEKCIEEGRMKVTN